MQDRSRNDAAYWLPVFAFIVLAATPVLPADPATQDAEVVVFAQVTIPPTMKGEYESPSLVGGF